MAAGESISTLKQQGQAGSLLQQGIEAARAGDEDQARRYLVQAVRLDSQSADAWFWLGLMLDDPRKQLRCMRRVLYLDPTHQYAREAIEQLHEYMTDGEIEPAAEPPEVVEAVETVEEAEPPAVQNTTNGKPAQAPAASLDEDEDDFFAVSHPQLSSDAPASVAGGAPAAKVDEDDDPFSWDWETTASEPAGQGDGLAAVAPEPEPEEPTLIPWGEWPAEAETEASAGEIDISNFDWGPPPELDELEEALLPAPELELPPVPQAAPVEPQPRRAASRTGTQQSARTAQARRRKRPGVLRAWMAALVFNRRMAYDAYRDRARPLRTAFLMLLIITVAVFAASVLPTLEDYEAIDQDDLPRFVGESLAYALLIAGQVVFALLVSSMLAAFAGRRFGSRVRAGTHFGLSGLWYVPVTVLSIGLAAGTWAVNDALASSSTEIDPVILIIGFGCIVVIGAAYLMGQMVYSSAAIHRVGISAAIAIAVVAFLVTGLILAWSLPLTLMSAG